MAWLTGVTKGFADSGLALHDAEAFIGTSAGAVLGAQLAAAVPIDYLFDRQADPDKQPIEVVPDLQNLAALGQKLSLPKNEEGEWLRNIGEIARGAQTIGFSQRRADISRRLGFSSDAWPAKTFDHHGRRLGCWRTGDLRGLERGRPGGCRRSELRSAGIWPITSINGRHFNDGGVWLTSENAHLALGAKQVLILAPTGGLTLLEADVELLEAKGSIVIVVEPDDATQATAVPHKLDPSTRQAAPDAGLAQGQRSADSVGDFLL